MFKSKKSTRDLVHGGQPIESPADSGAGHEKEKRPKARKDKLSKGEKTSLEGIFRSKALWGSLCLVAALLIAFIIAPMWQSRAAALAPVVVLTRSAASGEKITQDMLSVVEIGAAGIPQGAVTSLDEAVGQYLAVDGLAGDILTIPRLLPQYPTDDPVLLDLPAGKVAMAASLGTLEQSVASKLRAGDVIQLFAVLDNMMADNGSVAASIIPELRAVEVLSVTNDNAEDIGDRDFFSDVEDRRIATVVLALNPQQAATLAGVEENATFYAALVTRGDPARAEAALAAQDNYFSSLEVGNEEADDLGEDSNEGRENE